MAEREEGEMWFILLMAIIFIVAMWVLFGALAGWLAGLLMGTNREQGFWSDALLGIIGGVAGGLVFRLFNLQYGGVLWSLLTAVVGAVILVAIVRLFRGGKQVPT